jgi:hypothetical protein
MSIEEIINQALVELGTNRRIQDIYEGSRASRAALEVYGQTRDELLDAHDWPIARRTATLTLLKGPPPPGGYNPVTPWTTAYPKPGWLYEYQYPADCLEFQAIIAPPGAMFDLDPQPAVWRVDNDASFTPPEKVVLSNVKGALGVFTAQVTDPNVWEPWFRAVLIKALKAKLALALGGDLELEKEAMAETMVVTKQVDQNRG